MTDQEINIAIAEACGWHDFHKLGEHGWFGCDPKREGLGRFKIEDYCADLNAMHDVVNSLSIEQRMDWLVKLDNIVLRDNPKDVAWYPLRLLNATAHQRAEAFLRTIGKWKSGGER